MQIGRLWPLGLLLAGCSAPDPGGAVSYTPRAPNTSSTGPSETPPPPALTGGGGGGGSFLAPNDAGSASGEGGGGGFFVGSYMSNPSGELAASNHTMAAQGFTDPAGRDCFTCHQAGGPGVAFVIGGTVYDSAAGTAVLPNVEIRVVAADGTQVTDLQSDANGNFWLSGTSTKLVGAKVGLRNGTGDALMTGTLAMGGCQSTGCHDTADQGRIHLP